jgi:hypothetical protein
MKSASSLGKYEDEWYEGDWHRKEKVKFRPLLYYRSVSAAGSSNCHKDFRLDSRYTSYDFVNFFSKEDLLISNPTFD